MPIFTLNGIQRWIPKVAELSEFVDKRIETGCQANYFHNYRRL